MFGNYGNPYTNPYANMQSRLATMEQQYQQYNKPQMPVSLSGRMVTGIEEARASQISLDGTPSYFPSPAENKIYVKAVDMNGLPMFLTYELKMQDPGNINVNSVENTQISELNSRISAIENKLKELEKNGSDAINANA